METPELTKWRVNQLEGAMSNKILQKIIDGTIETMPDREELEGEPDIDAIEEQIKEQEEIEEERIGREQGDWAVGHNLRFI